MIDASVMQLQLPVAVHRWSAQCLALDGYHASCVHIYPNVPADASVYPVELPPAFHDLRLMTEHRPTIAAAAASCRPTAGALNANATRPDKAAKPP